MIVAGVCRLGFVADLFSKPTQIGYMNGLALTILVGQLPKLFGFSIDADSFLDELTRLRAGGGRRRDGPRGPRHRRGGPGRSSWCSAGWRPRSRGCWSPWSRASPPSSLFDLGSDGRRRWWASCPRASRRSPCPAWRWADLPLLVAGALGITLVSLTDTISTSSAFAERTGQEVDANQEMIGIGTANLAAGLFQGFPVSTSGSRTAVAEQSGAKTQLTGVVGRPADRRHAPARAGAVPEPAPAGAGVGGDRRLAVARRHPRHGRASGSSAGRTSPWRWPPSAASPSSACCPASPSRSSSRS